MAYTKYSLTPSSNTAAPPDGAPEGMLPSAVNDTMRDMMAQIRDCGDGIRDGTYTMTAPKITGGTITGSTINNSAIGGTTAAAGKFTTLEATGVATFSAGAVGTPAITTTGDTNTGIFFPAADTIAFTEGGAESMRIDSSGNVGIGTSSPSKLLDVAGNAAITGTGVLSLQRPIVPTFGQGTPQLVFQYYTTGTTYTTGAQIQGIADGSWSSTSAPTNMLFYTCPSASTTILERMRIDSSGNVLVGITSARANAGDVQVSKGISFPATQSAQSDANTLDDYEEGTWTPVIRGGTTAGTTTYASNRNGRYTKVGNIVTVQFTVGWTNATGTGALEISGLPFTTNSPQFYDNVGPVMTNNLDLPNSGAALNTYAPSNVVYMNLYVTIDNGGLQIVNMDTAADIYGALTYFTAT
jgi:hypothetical protein